MGETEDETADVVYLKIISFLQLFIGRGTITHARGVQRTIYRSQFSPPTIGVLGKVARFGGKRLYLLSHLA